MKIKTILYFILICNLSLKGQEKVMKIENEIVIKLEELEYFKFLNESDKVPFSQYLAENIKNGWLDMPSQVYIDLMNKIPIQRNLPESIDRRSSIVDGEYLFRGGLVTVLEKFKPIFEARLLKFEISQNEEKYSGTKNNHLEHRISINNREYLVFNEKMERGNSEMKYLKSLIRIINEELTKQEYSQEQFYVLTSMETLYYLLIDIKTKNYIDSLEQKVKSRIIDLTKY
ncbi:MAG: hypothetical protein IT245_05905 [Bacteroidia bacterium]|nr:hypothetical protein [Bacteroidia bacterium]